MRRLPEAARDGPAGQAGFILLVTLLIAAPVMRGGNRPAALIAIELLALAILLLMGWHSHQRLKQVQQDARLFRAAVGAQPALFVVLLSPLWLAVVSLTPMPIEWWSALPARSDYLSAMQQAGARVPLALPLSVVPMATAESLLAGLPLIAAFLGGRWVRLSQLRILAWVVMLMAMLQIVLGLLQVSGGAQSALYFGAIPGRPIGTYANANHLANYLGMAMLLSVWLAIISLGGNDDKYWRARAVLSSPPHAQLAWGAVLTLLLMGMLMTLSRGAILSTMPMLGIAVTWIGARIWRGERAGRRTALLLAVIAGSALAVLGIGSLLARFATAELAGSAGFRTALALRSLEAATEFWPWGAGWGAYPQAFQRFQPDSIAAYVGHAHQDYAELLFDGGIFAVVLMVAAGWLIVQRALHLVRELNAHSHVHREIPAMVLCGLGLAGFLLHSLVDFNMRIPANAILACLLAGVYLRPMREHPSP